MALAYRKITMIGEEWFFKFFHRNFCDFVVAFASPEFTTKGIESLASFNHNHSDNEFRKNSFFCCCTTHEYIQKELVRSGKGLRDEENGPDLSLQIFS
jgi:hypothetical protein